MIIVNNTSYTSSKIVLTGLYVGDIVNLSSDSSLVTWEIIKNPTTEDDVDAYFRISQNKISTMNAEELPLDLIGTYFIKCRERDPNGNYSETKIYLRSNSTLTDASLPFNGETDEINDNGWGDVLLRYILKIENLITPLFFTEVDGGESTYNGNETELYGGSAICAFGFTIDGGSATAQYDEIDGGSAFS